MRPEHRPVDPADRLVWLPADGDDTTSLASEAGTLEFDVPATGDIEDTTNAGVLLDGSDDDTSIAVESTNLGVRALIHIDSEDAPERFEFPVSGDVASLTLNEDGSVDALNADGDLIATAATPWAVDATGRDVPTHYEIDGTTLVQVVEHHGGGFEYGITADPAWVAVLAAAARTCAGGALGGISTTVLLDIYHGKASKRRRTWKTPQQGASWRLAAGRLRWR